MHQMKLPLMQKKIQTSPLFMLKYYGKNVSIC